MLSARTSARLFSTSDLKSMNLLDEDAIGSAGDGFLPVGPAFRQEC